MSCLGNTVQDILTVAGITVDPPLSLVDPSTGTISRGNPDLDTLAGIIRNLEYMDRLNKAVGRLVTIHRAAGLKSDKNYFNTRTQQYQPYPPFVSGSTGDRAAQFDNLANTLATLVFSKVLTEGAELPIPTIDRFSGEFCIPDEQEAEQFVSQEIFGVPSQAVFTISDRINNIDRRGFSFTSVDITAKAAFGNIVTDVRGLSLVSWSVHRDKNSDRRLNEKKSTEHARGAQTVAGSLIFSLFDEDPVRGFVPVEMFHGDTPIAGPDGFTDIEEMLPTDIPRFDLALTFTNEYGAAASCVIWGVDITDAGTALSTRQLENDYTVQFKALDMDPLKPAALDEDRELGFFGSGGGIENTFERKRRAALFEDRAGRDFEALYRSTLSQIVNNLNLN